MSGIGIVDASPLIVLSRVGRSNLLTRAFDEVWIPESVASEVAAGPEDDPARELLATGFGRIVPTITIPNSIVEWGLGSGESAVLALGHANSGATLVIDDGAGRLCAKGLGLPLLGTLGLIVRARRSGWIESAGAVLGFVLKLTPPGLPRWNQVFALLGITEIME